LTRLRSLQRGGAYFRLFKPGWSDPLDTSYSKSRGGRWTPPGEFGALYLNATIEVAAANARAQHTGRAVGLFDLLPQRRPSLMTVDLPKSEVADVVTDAGVAAAGFPLEYPLGVDHPACWQVARFSYGDAGFAGIASRSNAECTPSHCVGEELAWFDRSSQPAAGRRRTFEEWYPGPHP
jgi:hypothetical protein